MVTPPLGDAERHELVDAIHASPTMVVVAVAGGGNALVTDLLDVGGASRSVLEIVVPYAATAMTDFTGPVPEGRSVVSAEHAEVMARTALARAEALVDDGDRRRPPVLGLAITAALATDRRRRGDNRAHIALATGDRVHHRSVALVKGRLDRRGEDRVVADDALRLLHAHI